jgi:mono/diheme cytochrome c family protein
MKVLQSIQIFTALLSGILLLSGGAALAQTKPPGQNQKVYEQLIYSVKGPDLYRAHCATCHGSNAKGDGPMAAALKTLPADLTLLAKKNHGEFPANQVRQFITGDQGSASHGSREMPVWGPIFHQVEDDKDFGNVRLENLVKYLQTLQQK